MKKAIVVLAFLLGSGTPILAQFDSGRTGRNGGGGGGGGNPPLILGSSIGTNPCNPTAGQDAVCLGGVGGNGPESSVNGGAFAAIAQCLTTSPCVLANPSGALGQLEPLATGMYALSNNCNPANAGRCFYSPANTQVDNTASWTNASSTITITDGKFKSTDVGKIAWGFSNNNFGGGTQNGCTPYVPQPASAAITATHLTIATFVDSNHVTLSGTPAASSVNSISCFIWGNPDDAGASALETAYAASASCPRVILQSGYYMFTAPHFNSQPAACQNLPQVANPSTIDQANGGRNTLGNVFYHGGFDLEGRGVGTTEWFLPPDFPESGSCNVGVGNNACFNVVGEGIWHDFAIESGSGAYGMPTNTTLVDVGVGTLTFFGCYGIGGQVSGTVGVQIHYQAQLQQVNLSACGSTAYLINSDTSTLNGTLWPEAKGYRLSADNCNTDCFVFQNQSVFFCSSCSSFGTLNTGGGLAMFHNQGGELWLSDASATQLVQTTPTTSYSCTTNNGCILHADHVVFGRGSAGVPTNGLFCSAQCTVYMKDSYVTASGGGNLGWWDDTATGGSKFYSLGGNILTGSTTVASGGAVVLSPTDNLSGATTYSPGCGVTGAGAGASCVVGTGGTDSAGTMYVASGTGPSSSGTFTLNLKGTYATVNTQCTFTLSNKGQNWNARATAIAGSTTNTMAIVNWDNNAVNLSASSSFYGISYSCQGTP